MLENVYYVLASIFIVLLIFVLVATIVIGALFLFGIRKFSRDMNSRGNQLLTALTQPRPGKINLTTFAPLLPLLPYILKMMSNFRKRKG